MFVERVISSFGIVLILGAGMFLGGWVWLALVTLVTMGALKEYAYMLADKGYKVPLPLMLLLAILILVLSVSWPC